ncbi:MAG: hypothetical protein AB2792_19915 [Candidatus Thiodiazotropha sp.]
MNEQRIKKTFEIETSPAVMERFERFLALLHYNSAFGHSSTFAMALDGDGADKVVISPRPRFKNEVDVTGGIGGDVEIALDDGYMAKRISNLGSDWFVGPAAALYKNGEIQKVIPKNLRK